MKTEVDKLLYTIAKWGFGCSSTTMIRALLDLKFDDYKGGGTPYDKGDFGKCYDIIASVPSLKDDFDKLRNYSREWKNIANHWDEICQCYLSDSTHNKFSDMLTKIKDIDKPITNPSDYWRK